MMHQITKQRSTISYRILSAFIAITFISSSILPPSVSYAQVTSQTIFNLPAPGVMVPLSQDFTPTMVYGLTLHPDNPLKF